MSCLLFRRIELCFTPVLLTSSQLDGMTSIDRAFHSELLFLSDSESLLGFRV